MPFYRLNIFKYKLLCALLISALCFKTASAQTAWYVDGYHGGIYGGYPQFYTRFLVDMLNKNPDWKINLEIEPETWDIVQKNDSAAFAQFKALAADQSANGRVEFINPDYAQSYLYNISGESIISQFSYGMRKIRAHFPNAAFTSYSSEEPCFTSALPQILTSFGIKYASLKNPNTCFGGYVAAHGGELVTWIGPDGTGITTAPRYAIEKLSNKSTWQTIAWENSPNYVNTALAAGIRHPVGMTIQDAGWKGGPFMGTGLRFGIKTIYTTWRNYFEKVAPTDARPAWKPTQEDMLVNLVWGSQVTQKIAQEVRVAENKIISAEKLASLAKIYKDQPYPAVALDSAWRTLLLSQHHDCWIVPYNGKPGATWADKVLQWTNYTDRKCDSIINSSTANKVSPADGSGTNVRVYNTLGVNRSELVSVAVPGQLMANSARVIDAKGQIVPIQIVNDSTSAPKKILFKATAPSMGYNTYHIEAGRVAAGKGASVAKLRDGNYRIETDLYTILIDAHKGGIIKNLIAKKLNNKEFADKSNPRGFNELRGNFYKDGGFKSSEDQPADVKVLENGPLQVKLAINGTIDNYPFTEYLTVGQGQQRIDLRVNIDWKGNPGIGEETPAGTYSWQNPKKAFYDDRYKLLALFPLNLKEQKVYKNAPFDVTESRLSNTFYNSWDSIKNNVILNWVDVTDHQGKYGMALFTDHTTSYAHGTDFPLGLDLQYSGMGLWGRDYKIDGPTTIHYSLLPHAGKWDQSHIWTAGTALAEPLIASLSDAKANPAESFINIDKPGFEISSMTFNRDTLLVRVYNAEGDAFPRKITFNGKIEKAELVELNGATREVMKMNADGKNTVINLAMPRYGFRTLKLTGVRVSDKKTRAQTDAENWANFQKFIEYGIHNDWPNLTRYDDANKKLEALPADPTRVVFMGNSITDNWGNLIDSDFFKINHYICRGIGGQTTPQMLVRFREDVINLKPAVVVILAGTNDIAENTGSSKLENVFGNIVSMAELAKVNNIRVVVCSVLPAIDFPWHPGLHPAEKIVKLNEMLKIYAAQNGIVYTNYYDAMVDERKGLKKELAMDGVVHPNMAGYKIMEPLVKKAIYEAMMRK